MLQQNKHGIYQGGEVSVGKGLQVRVCRTLSLGKMGNPLSLRCNSRDKEQRVRCLDYWENILENISSGVGKGAPLEIIHKLITV